MEDLQDTTAVGAGVHTCDGIGLILYTTGVGRGEPADTSQRWDPGGHLKLCREWEKVPVKN